MTKHTQKAGNLPNGSIDFEKVQAAARVGKEDVFKGAASHQRADPKSWPAQAEEPVAADGER